LPLQGAWGNKHKTQGDALGYVLLPFQGVPVKSSARIGLLLSGRAGKKQRPNWATPFRACSYDYLNSAKRPERATTPSPGQHPGYKRQWHKRPERAKALKQN